MTRAFFRHSLSQPLPTNEWAIVLVLPLLPLLPLLLLLLLLPHMHMHGLRERKGNEEMNVNVERNELNGPPNSTPFFGTPVWYLLVTVLSYFYSDHFRQELSTRSFPENHYRV